MSAASSTVMQTLQGFAIMMTFTNQIFVQNTATGKEAIPELLSTGQVAWDRIFDTPEPVTKTLKSLLMKQRAIRRSRDFVNGTGWSREDFIHG